MGDMALDQAKMVENIFQRLNETTSRFESLESRVENVEVNGNRSCYRFQGTACMDSTDATQPDSIFTSTMTGDIEGIRIYHSSGYVSCNRRPCWQRHYGRRSSKSLGLRPKCSFYGRIRC